MASPDKSQSSPIKTKKRRLVIEPSSLSEQEQIELAIGRSLQESATNASSSSRTKNSDNSDADDDDEDDDNEDEDDEDENENENENSFDDSSLDENVAQSNEKETLEEPEQDMPTLETNTEVIEQQVTNSTASYDNYLGAPSGKF